MIGSTSVGSVGLCAELAHLYQVLYKYCIVHSDSVKGFKTSHQPAVKLRSLTGANAGSSCR